MYCKQCGKEIAPGTRFCVGCGAPIGKATPQLALPRGIDRKIWLVLGAVVGVVFLGTIGTFVVDNWLKNSSTNAVPKKVNAVPKSVDDLRAVDLASLVFQPNDLPLDKLGLVAIEDERWAASAEDVRSLDHHIGKDNINNIRGHFAMPSVPQRGLGSLYVRLYANVLSAQNQYQENYDGNMKIEKAKVHEVSDVGERSQAVIGNVATTFQFLRCHAFVLLSGVQAPVSPAAVLAYGKRLDERLRTAACP